MGAETETTGNSLENAIGSKVAVWVGAIALALGGVFLVKYSIEHGFLGPELRVVGGLALGSALGAVSWALRERSNYVSQGLGGAGVICLYATLWAATDLYELIPPVVGLAGMVATTVLGVGAALRLGPLVAIIGLLGAFLAPLLVGQREPEPVGLFAYLLALQAGAHFIARKRRWMWASMIGIGAGAVWVLVHVVTGAGGDIVPGLFVLVSTGVFALPELIRPNAERGHIAMVWGSSVAGASLLGLHLGLTDFEPTVWILFAILSSCIGALGVWRHRYASLPWAAFAFTAVAALLHLGADAWPAVNSVWLMFGLAGLFLAIGFTGVWREPAGSFRWLASLAPAAFFLPALAYHNDMLTVYGDYFWMLAMLSIAVTYALLAVTTVVFRKRIDPRSITALIVPALGFCALACPLGLGLHWCVLMWSAQLVGTVVIHRLLKLRGVHGAGVATMLGLDLLLLSPVVLLITPDVGATPVLNTLSLVYVGAVAANLISRAVVSDVRLRAVYAILTTMLVVAGVSLNVHHIFNHGDLLGSSFPAMEWSALVIVAMGAAGWSVFRATRREDAVASDLLRHFGQTLALTALIGGVLVTYTLGNPWVRHEPVHGVIFFNTLLLGIGIPALMAGGISCLLGKRGYAQTRQAAWWITGYLIALFVTAQLRHAFHGAELWVGEVTSAENYAYSFALGALAMLALAIGILRKSRQMRILALCGMGVCSLKVFVWDMRELEDIFRVLSFLGLGGSLMGLGYVYQRFVPKPPKREPTPTNKEQPTDSNPPSWRCEEAALSKPRKFGG